ncbi:DUF4184 family protein [Thiorhodococcus minor]|uniref:DUF4184 family protein n=1 Tax=Thiorhodococcus minor TaxID=57489 RepID=A0A6M0K0G9_9GAMM|nr:DUF4184 family protein [Thiorhodococcus minor]NEV63240.1 DUF4184 family protein [Thiorhodococcus minor]
MPFTPLHLGPGAVLKSLTGPTFSLSVFAIAQLAMDVEVVARALTDRAVLHGFTNTLAGATLVAFTCGLIGRALGEHSLHWWNRQLSPTQAKRLAVRAQISQTAAWSGALIGAYSHWLLDAIMHADARPLAPFAASNPFLGLVSTTQLHRFCLWSLGLGVLIMVARRLLAGRVERI